MTPLRSLSAEDQKELKIKFAAVQGLRRVILFGSRAMGTQHEGSDVDLAIECETSADPAEVVRKLSTLLNEESSFPYRFDVLALKDLSHPGLLEHIQQFGKEIWRR